MTVHVLIRGDLLDVGSFYTTAPGVATHRVIGQESAEAIVGVGIHRSWWRGSWKRARRIEKLGGLIPPKGQTRSMGNSPYVLRNAMNPTG
ncbi:MAG: hypothetical protein JRC66_07735 [Deltaproteobacteria bacterium]|nr:hypothetical protein [Deltaproteobacteria bacterium]MBW2650876.1 hypothetical protein [Deltaproteobacteria bacterium]